MKKYFKTILILTAICLLAAPAGSALATGGDRSLTLTDARGIDGWPSAPQISSRSAFVVELNSGEVLYSKNEDEDRYPASITKVMTALLVLENCSLDEEVTFSKASVTDIEDGGHDWRFKEGEVLTVEQCLYALMLNSVNECGYALAEHVAGSVAAFADMMNEKAASLGCTNTHFANPHGLNNPEHITTAHDMALIFWAALQNEKFYEIDSTISYKIPGTELCPEGYSLQMHHKMMIKGSGYYNENVKAGKTGYTSLAKHTLVTYAEKDGAEIVAVVMKEPTGGGVIYEDTLTLLKYGFDKFTLTDLGTAAKNIAYGINGSAPLPVSAPDSLYAYLPSSYSDISAAFTDAGGGAQGAIAVMSGGNTLFTRSLDINTAALSVEKPTEPEEIPESTAASQADEAPAKEGSVWGTILKIILIVIIALIVLVIFYWVVIQFLKRRRMRLRRKQMKRKAEIQRIRRLREQQRKDAEDFGI